jgi:hypothetical protein
VSWSAAEDGALRRAVDGAFAGAGAVLGIRAPRHIVSGVPRTVTILYAKSLYKIFLGPQITFPSEKGAKPSWPRSWANFSPLWLYSHRIARANLHLLGRPNTVLALGARRIARAGGESPPSWVAVAREIALPGRSASASQKPATLSFYTVIDYR